MAKLSETQIVAVIGAGTMGAGIAQVAAQAGHSVLLHDATPGAADVSKARLAEGLRALLARGKRTAIDIEGTLGRIQVAKALEDLAPAQLVVEAIVERLDVKRKVFAALEDIVSSDAIFATNTSSISVTQIAADLRSPSRLAGMHFFNPAPVMKLVEIISGLETAPEIAATLHDTAVAWGKIAVHARSTPGFIVNRVARGYYGEALRLMEEGVADPATIDALMTGGGGFPMGPFSLMDLIGHDVNYAVNKSVFDAYHQEPRFRPSFLQLEMVNAGRLGRKSGRGFYDYAPGAARPVPAAAEAPGDSTAWPGFELLEHQEVEGVCVALTDGRTADEYARAAGHPVILFDLVDRNQPNARLGFTTSAALPGPARDTFLASLAAQGIRATELPDWPGLVVMRTLAVIVNEAFEAVLQGVCDESGVDLAMRYGVNYPLGPIGWARDIGVARILSVLENLQRLTGDIRYRASFGLRRAVLPNDSRLIVDDWRVHGAA